MSTGPLEQFFAATAPVLAPRAARMTNKRRADALLKLLAAKRNGWVKHEEWTAVLADYLTHRRGLAGHQRKRADPRATPSLR